MARQMGLGPEDLKQMSSMWKNMDSLAATDPETYRKFTSDILAEGPPEKGKETKSFVPTPSFVVKLKSLPINDSKVTGGDFLQQKVFLNMTSCNALEPPSDQFGRQVDVG
jgi:hypothetical protein